MNVLDEATGLEFLGPMDHAPLPSVTMPVLTDPTLGWITRLHEWATVSDSGVVRAMLAGAVGRNGHPDVALRWTKSLRPRSIRTIEADITRIGTALDCELSAVTELHNVDFDLTMIVKNWLIARDNLDSALHCLVIIECGESAGRLLRQIDVRASNNKAMQSVRGIQSAQLLTALSENPEAWWYPLLDER